jgi:CSLREA domain-containing protein
MSRTSYLRRPLTALLVAAALAVSVVMAVVVLASPAWAATYTVNSTADTDDGVCTSVSGGCTLREAINAANTTTGVADTINFNLGSAATITLTSAQLPPITDGTELTIDGGSADITISGDNQYRVFEVGSDAKLTVSNLTVANSGDATALGGGIYNGGGTLEVSNTTLSGNSSDGGGGIFNGGGTATVSNTTLSGNSANEFGGGGGIYNYHGTLEVSNTTLSGNSVPNGVGGGILNVGGTLEVINSALSGNSAPNGFGGGILSDVSASDSVAGPNTVSNTTLWGNTATASGFDGGGGIYNRGGGTVTLKNTIVANSPSASGGNCHGTPITNGGYNLDSDNTCGFGTDNNSLSGVDPMLGDLEDNGGPTMTHALLEGSPAIDKGDSFGESTDQRGLPRPSDFVGIVNAADGNGSDIGAFELQSDTTPPKVTSTVPANGREVGPAANIRATFSEEMQSASVENAFKLFKKGSTTQIAAVVSYDAATDKATLNPNNNLRRGVTYKAVVTTVAKDLAGNRLDQNGSTTGLQQKVWYFTVD